MVDSWKSSEIRKKSRLDLIDFIHKVHSAPGGPGGGGGGEGRRRTLHSKMDSVLASHSVAPGLNHN